MIKTQIIREDKKPVAVIIDYIEYRRLKEVAQDVEDYANAIKIKRTNKKWTTQEELEKMLKL
jgi:hypothetical protein